jgi:YD repeat-containing protein
LINREIKNVNSGSSVFKDIQYTWDAANNLTQCQDLIGSETESFSYDSLDRPTSAFGPDSKSFSSGEFQSFLKLSNSVGQPRRGGGVPAGVFGGSKT